MNDRPIGLGVIGMGLNNLASTLTLLRDEPDLRHRITAIRSGAVVEVCNEFGIP